VLGEGGVVPLEPAFLEAAAVLAAEHGALLAFDEIQTGVGRTGTFFAWEQAGVRPDLAMLAKGLANGLPLGCLLVADEAAGEFSRAITPRRSVGTRSRVRRRAPSATRSTKTSSRVWGCAARSCGPGSAGSAPSGGRAAAAFSSAPSSTDRLARWRRSASSTGSW
jgi:hypothetical protein